jgi:mannan endo-1,4-beta-mannosidase
LTWGLRGAASNSNIVNNGSFEQGTTNWLLFGQGGGTLYTLTNNAADGALAMLAANRTNLSYHATQNILTNLVAEGSGVFYGIDFLINMAAPGSARMTLQMTDTSGSRTLILAEKIIASQTNRWVTIYGGRTISWSGTLTLASLRFEIGQIPERVYPTATLDRIRIVRDSDHDGLTDDVDAVPNDADANTNTIPDGWESLFNLPSVPGGTDSDGDGFSNVQEFWAATNPTNMLSKPAEPANTNATPETRAFLSYLVSLPTQSSNRVLVGQVVTDTAVDYTNQVVTLDQQTGRWPAMLGVVYDMINGPINHTVITPHATNWWNAGGVVHVQWNPDNPWNGNFSGNTNNIDFPALFTPGSASHSNYLAFLDEVAVGLRQLGNARLVVLFRPLNECNSVQNWYQRRAREEYIPLYRWTFDYLAKSQGLNHVLWVYDALDGPHQLIPVTYYYPGDDVVDVFGVNLYDDDWIPAFDLDRLSRDYPKPLAIPEGGPLTILNRSFTNLTYITAISNSFPRLSYFSIYNSFPFSSTNKHYSLVHNIGASNLFDHPWIITREELNWRAHLGPFGAWQLQNFTTNANNPVIGAWDADPDDDQARNLYEYATGSDPNQPSANTLVPRESGLSFLRNAAATDLVFSVEWTTNLVSAGWEPLAVKAHSSGWETNAAAVVFDPGDGAVTITRETTNSSEFYRLRIAWP